jgi:hypothetical protein
MQSIDQYLLSDKRLINRTEPIKKNKKESTIEELKKIWSWNYEKLHEKRVYHENGHLILKGKNIPSGQNYQGYYQIRITQPSGKPKGYLAHRMIWLFHHGYLKPNSIIDHIDGNTSNNRIENLREVTKSQNMWNCKISAYNTSGVKGITFVKKLNKWKAQFKCDGKHVYVGIFDTIEEAELMLIAERTKLHGDFARHE